MILPEARELAKEYPLTEDEVNEYVLTGLPIETVKALCVTRINGASFAETYEVAKWLQAEYASGTVLQNFFKSFAKEREM